MISVRVRGSEGCVGTSGTRTATSCSRTARRLDGGATGYRVGGRRADIPAARCRQSIGCQEDKEALQPHIRVFVKRAITFIRCPECGGTWLNEAALASRSSGITTADACAIQISDLTEWVGGIEEPSRVRACLHCWAECR